MLCPQCGKDASDNASFCSYCGGPLQQGAQFQANTVESVQQGYEEKLPPPPEYIHNAYTPAPSPNPYISGQPSNPYMPTQLPNSYTPGQPANPYTPNSYTPAQPANPYTPAQPPISYTPAQPANPYAAPTQLANSYPSVQPPKRRRGAVIILVSVVAVLIIVSSVIGVSAYRQQSAEHIAATSTASTGTAITGTAYAQATGTVVAEATATAQARVDPYSPTMQTFNGITLTSQQDTANWDVNTNCTYNQGYVISTTNGQLVSCIYDKNVDANYTVELSVNINNDNAQGGIILRETANAIEILYLDKGLVTLQVFDTQKQQNILLKNASAPIAVNTDALIGVVADHGVMTVFVNHEQALTIDDNRADIGQTNSFALIAASFNDKGASTATYKNVKFWTI